MYTFIRTISRLPSRPLIIQPPWWISLSTKAPVKNLLVILRLLLGEVLGELSGLAGRDRLGLRNLGLNPGGLNSSSVARGEAMVFWDGTYLPVTIWWATLTIELPQAAASPLKPSSVPADLILTSPEESCFLFTGVLPNKTCELMHKKITANVLFSHRQSKEPQTDKVAIPNQVL